MKITAIILLLAVSVKAQTSDPTGFAQFLVDQAKNTKTGGDVRLQDGRIGSVTYLPIKTFHTTDGKLNWFMMNAGVESMKGEPLRGIFFNSTDIVGVTNYLFFNNQWSKDHVTGSSFPPIYGGAGPAIPLDYAYLQHYTWDKFFKSFRLTVCVRFGDMVKL